LLCVTGCELIGDHSDVRLQGRIIPGVRLGDDEEIVLKKLGPPNGVHPLGDCSCVSYSYASGRFAGLTISIWTSSGTGVRGISAVSPYDGTTSSGVGIGTS